MEEKNEGFQETHSDNVESIDGLKENVTKQPFHIRRPKDWKDKSYRQLKDEVRKQFTLNSNATTATTAAQWDWKRHALTVPLEALVSNLL